MKPDPDPIRRLLRMARVSTAEVPTAESPYGFSTRLLSRLKEALPESPCERFALRALTSHETRGREDFPVAQTFIRTAV